MLGNHKLILDTHSEVYRELLPWADGEFWDLKQHEIVPGAVYVMCREQVNNYNHEIQELARSGQVTVILDNAAEGSETLVTWCFMKVLINLVEEGRILLIGGGDMRIRCPNIYENYLRMRFVIATPAFPAAL